MLQPLSEKQRQSLVESDARINIWDGSVRSGKSFSALLRFLELCMEDIPGEAIITGATAGSIKRNVIGELNNLLGNNFSYSAAKNEANILGRKTHVIGANNLRAERTIRGGTFGFGLADEGTLIPENFFNMLLSRHSYETSKVLVTTNPDNPFHWLKTGFIDRGDELDLKYFKFVLDDNPSLSERYKSALKKEYQGIYYQRYILGNWVAAEGAIYDFFDPLIHQLDYCPFSPTEYVVGVDYATATVTHFTMLAYNPYSYPRLCITKEFVWDAKKNNRQKTDSEQAEDLENFMDGYNVVSVRVDPSARSFIAECRRRGIPNIMDADNDVLTGIRFFSQLLADGILKICGNCKHLRKEIVTYCWNEKRSAEGIDEPKKENDHGCDSSRYAAMHYYNKIFESSNSDANTLNERYMAAINRGPRLPPQFIQPNRRF